MMGEYILYLHGRIVGYICDDRLVVKAVPAAKRILSEALAEAPYPGAQKLLAVKDTDDRAFLKRLFEAMYPELPESKPKKRNSR